MVMNRAGKGAVWRWGLVGICMLLGGCASVLYGDQQRVAVSARCGDRLVPAQCFLRNDRGHWQVQAPAQLVLQRDASVLEVACSSPFFGAQVLRVMPGADASLAGNLLVGGWVGAGVDVVTGAGLRYPAHIVVDYPSCR